MEEADLYTFVTEKLGWKSVFVIALEKLKFDAIDTLTIYIRVTNAKKMSASQVASRSKRLWSFRI